jgi:hypothetical protein
MSAALPADAAPAWGAWIVVLLLAVAAVIFVRAVKTGRLKWRMPAGAGAQGSTPVVIAQRPLAAHATVQVVRWHGKEYLLACTPHSIRLIDAREAAELPS